MGTSSDCEKIQYAEEKSRHWPQILAIFTVCLASFSNGLAFAWSSPFIPYLMSEESHIPITFQEASYFAVLPAIGCAISGFLFCYISDRFGRKKALILIALPHIISWTLVINAEKLIWLYVARFVTGISDGGIFTVLAAYIGEISEPEVRGVWGNLLALSIYVGTIVINVMAVHLSFHTTACVCLTVPALYLVLASFIPESPYYLLMKDRENDARNSLQRLRWMSNVDKELSKLTKDVQRQMSEKGSLKHVFSNFVNRKALLISMGIRASQQFSGLAAFTTYCQYIFQEAGGHLSKSTSAIIYQSLQAIFITAAIFFVGKCGRRLPMLVSIIGCDLILAIVATFFYIDRNTNIDTSSYQSLPLMGMLSFVIVSSMGLGIIPTLMLSELFSSSIKSKALSVLNVTFACFVLTSAKIFQIFADNFGLFAPFAVYAVCTFISIPFIYFYLPETKGKTLEEIQQMLRGNHKESKNEDIECDTYRKY